MIDRGRRVIVQMRVCRSSALSNNVRRNGHHRLGAFDPDSFRDTNGVMVAEDTPENVPGMGTFSSS